MAVRAWVWAKTGALSGDRAGASRRIDIVNVCCAYDYAQEEGYTVWKMIQPGNVVLIECPSRWYLGEISERNSVTFSLVPGMGKAACVHSISDFGRFLSGELPDGTEVTPLMGDIEINLASVDSVHAFPKDALKRVCVRTH